MIQQQPNERRMRMLGGVEGERAEGGCTPLFHALERYGSSGADPRVGVFDCALERCDNTLIVNPSQGCGGDFTHAGARIVQHFKHEIELPVPARQAEETRQIRFRGSLDSVREQVSGRICEGQRRTESESDQSAIRML